MAAPNTSGGGMPSAALASAAQAQLLAKRPRRGFTAEDDLAVLREVSAVKLFGDNLLWIRMIGSLKPVLGRETTLRSLKDRVDLLIGYWRQEDSRKLRRSGTEEQYAKKEQILQDLSEYTRSINYVLRIAPRSSNSSGRKRSHAAASCLATLPEQVRADGEQVLLLLNSLESRAMRRRRNSNTTTSSNNNSSTSSSNNTSSSSKKSSGSHNHRLQLSNEFL
ncbi:uncharacterized protein LOC119160768 [Rhipicephalus microplus]|uniref:uncharacterized protein LOC119160768 n=1 Tax=Rhipicephalus microplus TaxID=6941 RepID=UPI001886FC92|nr:uncharacterized protein LOC119160768 [Rhipicephalus microplus]